MSENDQESLKKTAEELFNFAIDRGYMKALMADLPESETIDVTAAGYELPMLRIITVGWGISFHLAGNDLRHELATLYWSTINNFSKEVSNSATLMTGEAVDYFSVLKTRLDGYIRVLKENPDAQQPAVAIGPAFAANCKSPDEVHLIMAGSRMFIATTAAVKTYFEEKGLIAPTPS